MVATALLLNILTIFILISSNKKRPTTSNTQSLAYGVLPDLNSVTIQVHLYNNQKISFVNTLFVLFSVICKQLHR